MMRKRLGFALGFVLLASFVSVAPAGAEIHLRESTAVTQFDRMGIRYQKLLTRDTFSDVSCERLLANKFRCQARWKVTAVSYEGVLTRFTFKARGTVTRTTDILFTQGLFHRWETVDGETTRTSSVPLKVTIQLPRKSGPFE